MVTMMPPATSRPVRTSQKERPVCTPSPSTDGHCTMAGSVLVAGAAGAGAAPRPRRAWPAAGMVERISSRRIDSARMSVVDAGDAGALGQVRRDDAAVADQLEELHARPRVVAEHAEHG